MSINVKSVPVEQVLNEIHRKAKLDFFYDAQLAKEWPKITLKLNNQTAGEIIGQVTNLINCSYTIKGNIVTITPQKMSGRERTVKGYVRDDTGEPLMGVPVCIGETRVCTVTDADGFYTFRIPVERTTLKFSYVGLATEYAQIPQGNGDVTRDIVLRSDNQIGEVVVTGIFQKAKESYTGAVSEISKEKLEMYKGTNLLQTLKNIDASINFPINNAAGSNPNVLPNLNIRGSSSLPMSVEEFNQNVSQTVNAPLIIMDGFEISLQKLMDYNDEQIESINILKDAAATAIYGSRGANGVIVVISKTPKVGKLRVTAKAGLSLEVPELSSYHLLNAKEKLTLEKAVGLYTDKTSPSAQVNLERYFSERMEAVAEGTDIDWLSKPLRNGLGQRYNIQLDGGANEFRWGASLGYNDVEGAMKGSSRRTLTGDITLMYSVKNLTFRNYSTITSNQAKESKYGSFQTYVDQQPYNNPYDEDGNLVKGFYSLAHSAVLLGNPLYDASLNSFDKSHYLEFINNFSVEWLITEGLRLRGKIGISTRNNTSDKFLPAEHSSFNGTEYSTTEGVLRKGSYTFGTGNSTLLSGDLTLSYSKTLAEKHLIYIGANYSVSDQKSNSKTFRAEGFSNADLHTIGNALQYEQNGTPGSSDTTVRMIGFTSNANYTYDNRYYVDLSYRIDGSSKFGSDKRFAPFWSAGIGWNLHNEKFLRENKVFNSLRLKASYGITGSQDFSTESTNTTYQYLSSSRYVGWSSATMMGLGNTELTWQQTKQTNVGLEFGMWKNRITGQLDVYTKKTSNLLSSMDLPLSTGFSAYTANVGEMKNSGVEASLNVYLIRNYERRFNWMIGGQFVYDKNEITKLSD
ncbi:MAG: SusC/RagA family TonB-linked outer membrane protein, partial [Prevotella sp.]|nr:SusC/RagA family TonB-linked outer membrane protein [Prevotella sp.]